MLLVRTPRLLLSTLQSLAGPLQVEHGIEALAVDPFSLVFVALHLSKVHILPRFGEDTGHRR